MVRLLNKAITISLAFILFGSVYISADEIDDNEIATEAIQSEYAGNEINETLESDGTELTDSIDSELPPTQTDYTESLKAINDKLYFIACTVFCGLLFNALAFMFDCFGKLIIGGKHE